MWISPSGGERAVEMDRLEPGRHDPVRGLHVPLQRQYPGRGQSCLAQPLLDGTRRGWSVSIRRRVGTAAMLH